MLNIKKTNFIIFCFALLFSSCKTEDSQKNIPQSSYLGSPQRASINIRFIPADFLKTQLFTSTFTNVDEKGVKSTKQNKTLLDSIFTEALKITPNLSKNWLLTVESNPEIEYTTLYLKASNITYLDSLIADKNIPTVDSLGIRYSKVQTTDNNHFIIFRDSDHILLSKVNGTKKAISNFIKSCHFSTKQEFITHFNTLFSNYRNSIDIRIKNPKPSTKRIKNRLTRQAIKNFNGLISITINPNNVSTEIHPQDNFKDYYASLTPNLYTGSSGNLHLYGNINFQELKKSLQKKGNYAFVDSLLHTAETSFQEMTTLLDGKFQLDYLGLKKSKEKSISYEFDENFNEVEKIVYHTTESYAFQGEIALPPDSRTKRWLLDKHLITPITKDIYEPVLGSKSRIIFNDSTLLINEPGKFKISQPIHTKFILHCTNIPQFMSDYGWTTKTPTLHAAKIEWTVDNRIILKTEFKGKPFEYLSDKNLQKRVKTLIFQEN